MVIYIKNSLMKRLLESIAVTDNFKLILKKRRIERRINQDD